MHLTADPAAAAIEPRWWTGTPAIDPARFTLDARQHGARELTELMASLFDAHGLVHVTNTGTTEQSALRRLAEPVVGSSSGYEGGANPRRLLGPNVFEVGAPLGASLQYHHEMAYVGQSRRTIAFLCTAAPDRSADPLRGATFASNARAVTEALLATELGGKLRDRGVCYHRFLTDRHSASPPEIGVYNHWQQSFGTDDPDEAAAVARTQGLEVEWGPDRLMATRYRCEAFEYHPASGLNLIFSSLADHGMWFDTWPGVSHLPRDRRPLDMTFGDGTRFSDDERRLWIETLDRFGTPLRWSPGDLAVLCNHRWAHGRPGIELGPGEERTLGVMLGPTFARTGTRLGAWPDARAETALIA